MCRVTIKRILLIVLITVWLAAVCLLVITAVTCIRYNNLLKTEIRLSEEARAEFNEHFEMQPPEYFHILNYTSGTEEKLEWFGVKAVVSKEDAEHLTDYLSNGENFSVMKVHRHDKCAGHSYAIDHLFSKNVDWWKLDIDRQSAHFLLTNHDETAYRYSAIVIENNFGIYYVYLWHETPARVYR